MKIAIIYPSFGVVSSVNQPNIKAVAQNYGIYPNMGLAYVAGALQATAHEILFLDAMASGYSLEDMLLLVKKFKPAILMFNLNTYLFHETLQVINYFKKRYNAKILVGGQHLTLFPNETLETEDIDLAIIGEAEETVVELLNALEKKQDLSKILGIAYKKNRKTKIIPARKKNMDLDKIPFPARNLLPMDKYYSFITKYKNYAIMMTSRGCPYRCIFCEQKTGDIRYRSAINVVDEMEECFSKYDVREIDIYDPIFTINKKRIATICIEIIKRNLKIHWSCRSRVDTIDKETLQLMKKAGCIRINFGIESADEKILHNIKKDISINSIRDAIYETKKNGIRSFGYFMFGCPGETKETINKTIQFAKELPLDYAQFNKFSILPGTSLYTELGCDYWKDYIKNKNAEKQLPRVNCALSDEEIDQHIKKAYMAFYFRPKILIRSVLDIKSLNEAIRYLKAAFEMIKNN